MQDLQRNVEPLIACSTGAISRWPDHTGYDRVVRWCPDIPAETFEIMLYDAWYPDLETAIRRIRDLALTVTTVHADKDIPNALLDDRDRAMRIWETNCAFASAVGASALVVHLWGYPVSDRQVDTQIAAIPDLVRIADTHGVSLAVESIPCLDRTPLEHLEKIVAIDDRVRVALDTEFLAIHDQLDAALEQAWLWDDARVVQVHLKDFDGEGFDADGGRRYLHPGEGDIPFARWIPALLAKGYRGPLTLESPVLLPDGKLNLDKLHHSLRLIRGWAGRDMAPES